MLINEVLKPREDIRYSKGFCTKEEWNSSNNETNKPTRTQ